ncbi:MAG: hypothetical protein JST62_04040, partial [Bacteroidetes bacterium]|nr:hypothetical protein [Bacteroidota bacterium]
VFDKGYNDYTAFKRFSDNETGFVTRIKDNAVYNIEEELAIDENIHFVKFLENPEKDWQRKKAKPPEPNLFNQPTLLF